MNFIIWVHFQNEYGQRKILEILYPRHLQSFLFKYAPWLCIGPFKRYVTQNPEILTPPPYVTLLTIF